MDLGSVLANVKRELSGGAPLPAPVEVAVKRDALWETVANKIASGLTLHNDPQDLDVVRASGVFYDCPRRRWFLRRHCRFPEERVLGVGEAVCFEIGTQLHKMTQAILCKSAPHGLSFGGWWVCPVSGCGYARTERNKAFPRTDCPTHGEMTFVEPIMSVPFKHVKLKGHADGVFFEDNLEEPIMLEIKTANDYAFNSLSSKGISMPYLWQMHAYMLGFGAKKGVFVFINKAKQSGKTLPMKILSVEQSPVISALVSSRLSIIDAIQGGELDSCTAGDSLLTPICGHGVAISNCEVALSCTKSLEKA